MLGGSEICGNKVFKHQNLLWKDHTTTGDVEATSGEAG
jgi:hypothetical protein